MIVKMRDWAIEEVDVLHTVAHNIGLRLNQNKTRLELENTLNELDFYMKSSNQAKWEWNLNTNEVDFSYNWFGMLGYDNNEFEHKFETWESKVHPDDFEPTKEKLNQYINGISDKYEGVFRMKHKLGHYIWIKYSAIMMRNNFGVPEKIIGTHIDISEIKTKRLNLQSKEMIMIIL